MRGVHRGRALRRCALGALLLASPAARADDVADATGLFRNLDAELRVTGMTFVGTRGDDTEFVLRAQRARFEPDTSLAHLEVMSVVSTESGAEPSFEVRCDRGEFDVESNDFLAEGDVRGTTADGRRYEAPWVRYEHDRALLYSDAPVLMQDESGTFRGDGFRYSVKERRFRLVGHVSLVAAP